MGFYEKGSENKVPPKQTRPNTGMTTKGKRIDDKPRDDHQINHFLLFRALSLHAPHISTNKRYYDTNDPLLDI